MFRIKSYLLIGIVFFASNVYSQDQEDMEGKSRKGGSLVSVGISNNFQYIAPNSDFIVVGNDLLLPKIEVALEQQTRKINMRAQLEYQMLPNIYRYTLVEGVDGNGYPIHNIDSIGVKSDNYKLGLKFRKFFQESNIGLYAQFGIGVNFITNKGIQSMYTRTFYEENNYSVTTSNHRVRKNTGFIAEVPVAFGNTFSLDNGMAIDAGVELTYLLASLAPLEVTQETDLLSPSTLKWSNTRLLFGSSLIEIYVCFQLHY